MLSRRFHNLRHLTDRRFFSRCFHRNVQICSEETTFNNSIKRKAVILGIETSCDDTGCGIVNCDGSVLGESLHSQQQIHLNHGGIIPPIAKRLHQQNIESVVQDALNSAAMTVSDVDAIATTVKPGLPLSLLVGMNYGKFLCRRYAKPLIPIHHMEAHALTIRMVQKVDFPFLVLLISGGHCLLCVAQAVDKFLLLGHSTDDSPGESLDKIARRLKLRNMTEYINMSGGQAIERAAERGDPLAFSFPSPMSDYRNCDFSFSGLKNTARRYIIAEEAKYGIEGDQLIPTVFDLCASFQFAVALHLCRRTQRAIDFVEQKNLLPQNNRTLVVAGGVACNKLIAKMLHVLCSEHLYQLAIPPPKLCTDNGIMIAWNGLERWKTAIGITNDLDSVDIEAKCNLGVDIRAEVSDANIKCKWIRQKVLIGSR